MIEIQQLLKLNDFKELEETALLDIAGQSGVNVHKKKQRLRAEDIKDNEIYLLDGEIELQGEDGSSHSFTSSSERAQAPIFRLNTPGLTGQCITPCKVLYINKSLIAKYKVRKEYQLDEMSVEELETLSGVDSKLSLVGEILEKFKSDNVRLPSLPEIALNISTTIEQDDISFKKLANIIQTDPAIAARLIQVANSAIFGTKIDSIQDAITKVGLQSVKSIVLCVVMRELYTPSHALIKKYMTQFYEHSIRMGVLCYDIARRVPGLDADHAFLVGLLHDVGTIPILVIADKHKDLAHQAGMLDKTLEQLKGHVGAILLKQWQFGDDYIHVAKNAYNWQYLTDLKSAKPDYCDLVQIALLHEQFVGGSKYLSAPPMSELPAFHRLGFAENDAAADIRTLSEVCNRIKEMIKLLCD